MRYFEEEYYYLQFNPEYPMNRFNEAWPVRSEDLRLRGEREGIIIYEDERLLNYHAANPPSEVIYCRSIFILCSRHPELDKMLAQSPVQCRKILYIDRLGAEYWYWELEWVDRLTGLLKPYMDLERSEYGDVYDDSFYVILEEGQEPVEVDYGPTYYAYDTLTKLTLDSAQIEQVPLEQRLCFSLAAAYRCRHNFFFHESIRHLFESEQTIALPMTEYSVPDRFRVDPSLDE